MPVEAYAEVLRPTTMSSRFTLAAKDFCFNVDDPVVVCVGVERQVTGPDLQEIVQPVAVGILCVVAEAIAVGIGLDGACLRAVDFLGVSQTIAV